MATSAKNKLKAARHEKMMKGDTPTLSSETYTRDLLRALNYYNYHHDDKEKKSWVLKYLKSFPNISKDLSKLDEKLFRHAGVLSKLIMDGSELQEKEERFLNEKIQELKAAAAKPIVTQVVVADAPVAVVSVQERIIEKASEIAGEFEGMIDEFVVNDKLFDAKEVLKQLQVSAPVAKFVAQYPNMVIQELKDVLDGQDEQLNEGYSHLKKTKIKKLLALYESIQEACGIHVQVAKATRAPRKRKEKPAGVLVAKMKFKMNDEEYGIKSISAPSIVNSQELWVFNTKYKKLQVYRAMDDMGLSVKGTTIIGYDPENSGSRTLRKPELVKDYASMGKRPLNAAYKALTTKQQAVNGRINEECILLKVF